MEGEIMFDRSRGLDRLDFQCCANVRKCTGAKRKRLGMVCLPSLVFGPQIERARMLEVGGQHNSFVTSFTGKLDSQVPRIQSDKSELEVVREQVFLCEGVETIDRITKGPGVADLVPGQSGETRWWKIFTSANKLRLHGKLSRIELTAESCDRGVDGFHQDAFAMQLGDVRQHGQLLVKGQVEAGRNKFTSSHDFASSSIQPSSMTSAESLVT